MNSKVYKYFFFACALFLIGCGDDSVSNASASNLTTSDAASSSDAIALSGSGAVLPQSSSAEISSDANGVFVPESSGDAAALSSGIVESSSSAEVVVSSCEGASAEQSSSSVSSSESNAESSSSEASKEEPAARPEIFLAQANDEDDGVAHEYFEYTGYDGKGILAYPKQLSNDKKHAVVVWGPGGDTEPGAYGGMIHRLASHGFVVIAISVSPGSGDNMIAAIDWLEKKNNDSNDPLYGKMDLTRVGCAGHSMGGLESEQAAIKDERVYTIVLNNSGDKAHEAMSKISKEKTMLNIYGEAGMERPNAEADYNNSGVVGGACLIMMTGGPQGGEGGWGHGSASWSGMAGTIAWMRWQLGNEDRKADFVGTSGKYIDGPIIGAQGHWDGQCKNF